MPANEVADPHIGDDQDRAGVRRILGFRLVFRIKIHLLGSGNKFGRGVVGSRSRKAGKAMNRLHEAAQAKLPAAPDWGKAGSAQSGQGLECCW
jgi:hypothetical protein